MDLLGWIGSIAFAFCGVPQAIQCKHQGHARGISLSFLLMWGLGEICYIISVWVQFGFVAWMMANYFCNIICISIMLYYYLFPRT